jgi:hypothetical protein
MLPRGQFAYWSDRYGLIKINNKSTFFNNERFMEELFAYRQVLLAELQSIVEQLAHVLRAIPDSAWHKPLLTHACTPYGVLIQLRELEAHWFAVQLPRLLYESSPELPACTEFKRVDSQNQPVEQTEDILEEFSRLRNQELIWLRTLTPSDWSRISRHPWYGVHTLQWWVEYQLDLSQQYLRELASVPLI